jgi:hypothetical protein
MRNPETDWLQVAADFSPHAIQVLPKWPEILLNYKLLAEKDEAEFRHLYEEGSFNTPIVFTVLQGQWGRDCPGLIFSDNSFKTNVDFSVFVPKFGLDTYFTECHGTPRLYFRRPRPSDEMLGADLTAVLTRFELVLEISAKWWKQLAATGGVRIPPIEVRSDGAAVDVELVLAVLPFSEILGHYDPCGIRNYGNTEEYRKTRRKELAQSGWKRIGCEEGLHSSFENSPELAALFKMTESTPIDGSIEHQYFVVSHWTI